MKLFDKRLVIASLLVNVLTLSLLLIYWRPIAQTITFQFTQALPCQQVMTGYTAHYKDLEKQISFWDEEKLDSGLYTDEERLLIQKIGVLDSRAGIILALCEAPLTEQTPFDSVPTITEVPTEGSKESSTSAEPTQ